MYIQASESVPNLIPGLDRALYHWDGNKLQTLPFRADDLIDSDPFSEGQGSTLAGSKAREVVGINVNNGKVRLSFNTNIIMPLKWLEI